MTVYTMYVDLYIHFVYVQYLYNLEYVCIGDSLDFYSVLFFGLTQVARQTGVQFLVWHKQSIKRIWILKK